VLLGEFRGGVHAARVERRVLAHQFRLQRPCTLPAARLEPARGQVLGGARGGAHRPVPGAAVRALAVHHHRRGQHQAVDSGPGGRGEQHRGAEVVVPDVLGKVVEVHPHADHRGLVHDGVHTAQRVGHRGGIAQVCAAHRRAGHLVGQRIPVRGRQSGVQNGHPVTGVGQHGGHVRTDETGAAGHEDMGHAAHGRPPGGPARRVPVNRQGSVRTAPGVSVS
jgi:hypothetical protein